VSKSGPETLDAERAETARKKKGRKKQEGGKKKGHPDGAYVITRGLTNTNNKRGK